ncbi:MAG: 23S rRNA (uracil(1939)-C(5))-methyltransferase RlmD [Bacilli bacterium]|jgi:23S rRNA (uracil1939-C5)-methyltransferase|nr:23S rRNA (uracil(1939)-C(5))-methyltransferase RlmD [Bacilli bacterium]
MNLVGEVIDYSHQGQGVVKIDNFIYFINNVLIGEIIEFQVIKKNKRYGFGKVIKIIEASNNRYQLNCSYDNCYNCNLKNMNYKEQVLFKKKAITNTLIKAKLSINDIDFIENDHCLNYRNKIVLHFTKNEDNKIKLGYFINKKLDINIINECLLVNDNINHIIKELNIILNDCHLSIYDYHKKNGILKHLIIRINYQNDFLIGIVINDNKVNDELNNLINKISNLVNVKGIIINFNQLNNSLLFSNNSILSYGKEYIIDHILDYQFRISINSFYQVNSYMLTKLYTKAIEIANFNKNDIVLDAYCGVGTISMLVSKYVNKVIGVDIVKEAINDACYNQELNNINNINFICSDVNDYLNNFSKDITSVILDPPRSGASLSFLKTLINNNINKIIYISCNPATLARDLKILEDNNYSINKVVGVDMFSYTYHVEAITLIELKN